MNENFYFPFELLNERPDNFTYVSGGEIWDNTSKTMIDARSTGAIYIHKNDSELKLIRTDHMARFNVMYRSKLVGIIINGEFKRCSNNF